MKKNIKKIFMLMLAFVATLSLAFAVSAEDDEHEHSYRTFITEATRYYDGFISEECDCGAVKSEATIYAASEITVSKMSYICDGQVKTPVVTIRDTEGNVLRKDVDYVVGYENGRILPGKYLIKIIFKGRYEGTEYIRFTIAPSVTNKITATSSANSIKLSWNEVPGATGYRVFIYNAKTKAYQILATIPDNTYTVANLKQGINYIFKIRAYTANGGILWGSPSAGFATATAPEATSKIIAAQSASDVTLKWAKVPGVTHYRVYVKTSKGWAPYSYTGKLAYNVKNLKAGVKYTFAVRSYIQTANGLVAGAFKEIQTATKPVATSKIIYSASTSAIALKWVKVPGVTHYRIFVKTSKEWKPLGYTDKNTYTVKNLSPARNYTYAVKSCIKTSSGMVEGQFVQIKAKTGMDKSVTKTPPHKVENVKITSTSTTATLSWKAVEGASGYRVFIYYDGWKILGDTEKTSYTATGLEPSTGRYFAVRPYKIIYDETIWSEGFTEAFVYTKPSTVDVMTALPMKNSLFLSWDCPYNFYEVKFDLYLYDTKTKKYTPVKKGIYDYYYNVTGLEKGKTYTFAIRSYHNGDWGGDLCYGALSKNFTFTTQTGDDSSLGMTEGGIKLYPIKSSTAKKIVYDWSLGFYDEVFDYPMYEGVAKDGRTIVFLACRSGWLGYDSAGAWCDPYGRREICDYCGEIRGDGKNMCYGLCSIYFV